MSLTIRTAEAADEAAFRTLWQGYLDFFRTTLAPGITDTTWARILDPASPLTARLAVTGDGVRGFALHHTHLSTWSIAPDCTLEDLFIAPETRGQGIGRALIDDLISLCRQNGWPRLYWHTHETNASARRLYNRYSQADGFVRYRIPL